jgi:hypothetical protein
MHPGQNLFKFNHSKLYLFYRYHYSLCGGNAPQVFLILFHEEVVGGALLRRGIGGVWIVSKNGVSVEQLPDLFAEPAAHTLLLIS